MKIEEVNANKTTRINKWFSVSIILGLVIFMISGSAATQLFAATQSLPSCTDPTGQNLPCMMIISTLPPPPNALQCQETSGQILPCSYTTQNLSNGEQIVAITVYVPTNYVFSSPTLIKVVVHETTTKTTTKTKIVFVTPCLKTQKWNPLTHKCEDICPPVKPGQKNVNPIFPSGCPPPPPPNPSCDSKYYTGPCPPTDPNALTKCLSAALAANDNKNGLACARLLPDTPENAYTKCISEALFNDDNIAALKCAKLLPPVNSAHNMTNTTTAATPSNTTAPINTTAGKPTALTPLSAATPKCVDNCTIGNGGPGNPVDCNANPNDPACIQTLTPPPTPPTTKSCPDGSVIDASATCPTPSTPPPTFSPPPSTSGNPTPPPSDNNPSPPSSSSNGGGGSNGNTNNGGGSSSGGGSGP